MLANTDALVRDAAERIIISVNGKTIARALEIIENVEVKVCSGRIEPYDDKAFFNRDMRLSQGARLAALKKARESILTSIVVDTEVPALAARFDHLLDAARSVA